MQGEGRNERKDPDDAGKGNKAPPPRASFMTKKIGSTQRRQAKQICYGIVYGMGAKGRLYF